jgi:hypothetical protein
MNRLAFYETLRSRTSTLFALRRGLVPEPGRPDFRMRAAEEEQVFP